jgi:hypothetical protein
MAIGSLPIKQVEYGVVILFLNGAFSAICDVLTDGLICINSRLDPVHGSQDLWTWAWIMQGFGGFTGCILGGYLCSTNNSRICFALVALLGLAVFFAGLKIDKKKE